MLLTHVRSVCVLLLSLVFSLVGSGSVNGQDRSSSDDGSVQAEAPVTEDTDGLARLSVQLWVLAMVASPWEIGSSSGTVEAIK